MFCAQLRLSIVARGVVSAPSLIYPSGIAESRGSCVPRDTIGGMISHGKRWQYAFRAFFSLIFHGRLADDILAAFAGISSSAVPAPAPVPPTAAPPDRGDRAVQLLAVLQRDGRLVDFLMEDLSAYPDAQVGAAVRDVHTNCRQSLARYVALGPVLDAEEGRRITVAPGTDPSRIKVVGPAAGQPPLQGVVRHRGWEATRLELPPLPSTGRTIVAPAEVEIA
jgi:Domain of unknown function (DUF2760)